MALTPILSTTSGLSPSTRARRLRSVLSEWELDDWIDTLDDDDIDYFYNLMMNGQMDHIMDAFRYDTEYDDYDRYYGDYYAEGEYHDDYYEMDNPPEVPNPAPVSVVCPPLP